MSHLDVFQGVPELCIGMQQSLLEESGPSSMWSTPSEMSSNEGSESPSSSSRQADRSIVLDDTSSSLDAVSSSTPAMESKDQLVHYPAAELQALIKSQEEKRRKLKRKAELARLSRRNKKVKMGILETQVSRLQQRIQELESENGKLRRSASSQEIKDSRAVASVTLESLISTVPDEPEKLADHIERLRATIEDRKSVVAKALLVIEKNIEPCLPVQFLEWVLTQRDPFYEDKAGLFMSLFHDELKLTQPQMKSLLKLRELVAPKKVSKSKKPKTLPVGKTEIESSLIHLSKLCNSHFLTDEASCFNKLCALLKPAQLAAYVKWVQRFGHVCIKIKV